MSKLIKTALLLAAFTLIVPELFAKETGRSITQKGIKATKVSGSEAVITLTIIDAKGRKRVRKMAQISKIYGKNEDEKRLIRFLAPADVKGTGLLSFDYSNKDDDMWLFMPALRKTRRIVSSEKAKSFMGSEFSYSDMTPPNLDDFKYKILGEEKIGDTPCWKVEAMPNNEDIADEYGFSKRILSIAKSDNVIRKGIYYDLDGELSKELTVHKVKLIDKKNKRYRPTHMTMINKQNGRKSIMLTEKIQFSPKVKDDYFTTRYLERP